ncbi:restriction endonuclease subunit S [Escherichia coli]|uniref:Restriction endonuclease subunit S n=7 Tax=Escherichia coli TaxID=562 RepID=A0AAN5G6S7_ECOLX|nr:restriction endonuclease subunit S [Escherichia coli]EEZ5803230.1 restriction endonuclease subunit S [Escherichia coli O105]HDJ1723116.1 restriction endonuclease subunit S [Salmonella enterica subsp. enterica serovar Muenster]APK08448.1 restriction endonuclease subunit S [Escherichia coli]EAC1524780.1 restriction endonuclease subunit S [Escherichia coli]EEV8731211.1 restriction endonuclease subunit S [Escherichia coli]
MVKLGDVINVHYGKALKADQRVSNGSVHVFGSSGIVGNHDKTLCSYPTIIIGRKGSVGAITWAPDGGWIIDTAYYVEIKDNNKLDLRYLFYILSGIDLTKKTITTSIPGLNRDDLYDTFIKLPPFEEQKRIVDLLDKAEGIRQKREQAIKLADDFLRATFATMYGNPITNPKKWPVHLMGEIIEFKGGNQPPKSDFIFEPKQGYIRLVQIRDFKSDKYATYIPQEKAKRIFEVDDVMIARYGPPVFQILRGLSGSYNVALMKASPKENIRKGFIFYLLQLPEYHDVVVKNSERTAGQTGVNLELLNKFNVPLPPIYYQDEILARLARIEKFKEKIEISLNHLEMQFLSLQKRLMGF